MKLYTKVFLLFCATLISNSAMGYHTFYTNTNEECWVDTSPENPYDDYFWYCGKQSKSCRGNDQNKDDGSRFVYHGDRFVFPNPNGDTNLYNLGKCENCKGEKVGKWADVASNTGLYIQKASYWCCGGTTTKSGRFVKGGADWIVETKEVIEGLSDGTTCRWQQKINVCGEVDNPQDKCTMPDNCAPGQILFPRICSNPTDDNVKAWCASNATVKRCVAPCQDGYVFANDTSPECVPCETTNSQGIKNGVCVKCESNQFFDKNTLGCVDKPDMLAITTAAHERCWTCSDPTTLELCMRVVSLNGSLPLPTDTALPSTVSVGSKNVSRTSKEYKSMYDDCTLFYDGSVERQSGTGSTTGNNYVGQANVHDSQPDVAVDTNFSDDLGDGTSAPVNTSNTSSGGGRGSDTSSGGRGQYGRIVK